jgi:hypothetical protein
VQHGADLILLDPFLDDPTSVNMVQSSLVSNTDQYLLSVGLATYIH